MYNELLNSHALVAEIFTKIPAPVEKEIFRFAFPFSERVRNRFGKPGRFFNSLSVYNELLNFHAILKKICPLALLACVFSACG